MDFLILTSELFLDSSLAFQYSPHLNILSPSASPSFIPLRDLGVCSAEF